MAFGKEILLTDTGNIVVVGRVMKEDELEEEAKSLTAVDSKASDDFMKADEVITR